MTGIRECGGRPAVEQTAPREWLRPHLGGQGPRLRSLFWCGSRLQNTLPIYRNPLHALAGSARFVVEDCSPSDAMYDDMLTILSCATQMSNLISAMVDWTGVNSTGFDVSNENVNVTDRIMDAVRCCACVHGVRSCRTAALQATHSTQSSDSTISNGLGRTVTSLTVLWPCSFYQTVVQGVFRLCAVAGSDGGAGPEHAPTRDNRH